MKRFITLSLIAALIAAMLCGCSSPADTGDIIISDEPMDTSELIIIEDETASPTPAKTPTPAPSATATIAPTPTVETVTEAPDQVDLSIATNFKSLVKDSEYVLLVDVEKDNGVVDVLKGTETAVLAPNAYIGEWQYSVKVTEVLKGKGDKDVKAGDTITYSIPYEYCMNKKTKPITKESSFIAIEEGKSYALFLYYDGDMKYFSPAGSEPNKFELKDEKLYIHTTQTDLATAWNAGSTGGIALSNLKSACK